MIAEIENQLGKKLTGRKPSRSSLQKTVRKRPNLNGFRYTKVRPCIEMEVFFEVFDTVEFVVQGHKLACAFVGLQNARK